MSNTLHTLNNKLVANKAKLETIRENNISIINEAIELVNNKITEISTNPDYKATERKAIKVIQVELFTPKNKEDKLTPKMKLAIKCVVVAHKRKVFDNILWADLSINKIDEVLKHLTVKEIQSIKTVEDTKGLLDSKKTETKEIKSYAPIAKK